MIAAYKAEQLDSIKRLLRLDAGHNFKPKGRISYKIAGHIQSDLKTNDLGRKIKYLNIHFEHSIILTLADEQESLFHLTTNIDNEVMARFLDLGIDYNLKLKW